MIATMSGLQVKGEAAPKAGNSSTSLSATIRVNRPNNGLVNMSRPYSLVFNSKAPNEDLTVTALTGPSVPVRKIEHLNRVRTANFGISTMDASYEYVGEPESPFVIEKPHFVLCGLPIGSKEIDHHLYVNETRVGSFKTSAKALYQARRGPRSAKTVSEPVNQMPDSSLINPNSSLPEAEEARRQSKPIPPIPPTTPQNYSHFISMVKPKTAQARMTTENGHFHGSIPSAELENSYIPSDLVKHKKLTLMRREKTTGDYFDLQREQSTVSTTHSIRSMETVSESVVNNSLTVTTGKGVRLVNKTVEKVPTKVNYNNPYRNTKHKERMALNSHKRMEFNSLDTYLRYQKQNNGRHVMAPRAILRIPKPCSDTFLLQMMYDLNRPTSRRSAKSTRFSELNRSKDLEDFVNTRTSSSLSKAQSNIDKYMGNTRQGAKSIKSIKSAKSVAADTIEEELEDIMNERFHEEQESIEKTDNINGDM